MAERLTRASCAGGLKFISRTGHILHTQLYKRFAIALSSTQVAVLPWLYDAEMDIANSFHASA